jgi:dihydrofolate reductase
MSNVILDMAISLDGCIATAEGEDGGLHDYFFSPSDATATIVQEGIRTTGAIIMGRLAYDLGAKSGGFVDDPYTAAQFVITHHAPATVAPGAEAFTFVTDGIASAIQQAKAAAGGKDVVIGGGANIARQFLEAGLVDELHLHVVPKILGNGMRLFDSGAGQLTLTLARAVAAPDALHVLYRVSRSDRV